MMKRITTLAVSAITILSLSACKSMPAYTSDYTKALEQVNGVVMDDQKAMDIGQRFVGAFNTLGTPSFVKNASNLYADQLYINDTLSQFSNKQELVKHFEGMNKRVSNVTVKLISATHHEDSAYIHWHMAYDFKMFGSTKTMDSYGISEIKVNPQQQIIFQQDFWDPANGLFRSLPVFGGAYKWVLPFKKS